MMVKGKPTDPLDPVFLIEHADRLTTSEGGGRPPTIDSRRAASAAYYSAYHATTRGIAQFLFGDSWLHGVRWLSHGAVIEATGLVSRLGPVAARDPGASPGLTFTDLCWKTLSPHMKNDFTAAILQATLLRMGDALGADTFDARDSRHLSISTIAVDWTGFDEIANGLDAFMNWVAEVEQQCVE